MIYNDEFRKNMYDEFKQWTKDEGYTMISESYEYLTAKSKLEMLCPENHHISINRNNWKSGKRCVGCYHGMGIVNGKQKCVVCGKWLNLSNFHKNKSTCKPCRLEEQRTEEGKKDCRKRNKKWEQSKKGREFQKKYKISKAISCRIRESLNGKKNNKHWENLVGFTLEEFKNHFNTLFQKGMTWNNHGEWHIDHIRPVSSFNIISYKCDDFKKCWSLDNLQPLWATDNLMKKDKWDGIINL